MNKNVFMALLIFIPLFSNAAQVVLGRFVLDAYGENYYVFEWLDHSFYEYQVFCEFTSGPLCQDWRLTPTEASSPQGQGGLVMYKAEPGSVVNHDSVQQPTYFVNVHGTRIAELADVPWTPLEDPNPNNPYVDEEVYLGIIFTDYYGDEMYGWIRLRVIDMYGKASIADMSAIDLEGGPMIVGGGAWEGGTPEPASGLLLLCGGALLALRRRRENGRIETP